MSSSLTQTVDDLVTSHDFFLSFMGSSSLTVKRRLARKLLLFEVRGRPWDSETSDLRRLGTDWAEWQPRPQGDQVRDRLISSLNRLTQTPFTPQDEMFASAELFPGVYWGMKHTSGVLLYHIRDVTLRYHGQGSFPVSSADRKRYTSLCARPDDGAANHERARLIMKYNVPDLPTALPGLALVHPATF